MLYRVSRRSEKLFFLHRKRRQGYPFEFFRVEILSFSDLLETLDWAMRLRPECKYGGSRPFQSWDIEIFIMA